MWPDQWTRVRGPCSPSLKAICKYADIPIFFLTLNSLLLVFHQLNHINLDVASRCSLWIWWIHHVIPLSLLGVPFDRKYGASQTYHRASVHS